LSNLIKKKFNSLSWKLNPYDDTAFKSGIRISEEDETHAINLEKGFDVIASNISKGHRDAVKQAIRNGVSVRISSSIEDWLNYYKIYETSVSRWGNRLVGGKYSWELFHEISIRNSPISNFGCLFIKIESFQDYFVFTQKDILSCGMARL
jgi:hypothetical protein